MKVSLYIKVAIFTESTIKIIQSLRPTNTCTQVYYLVIITTGCSSAIPVNRTDGWAVNAVTPHLAPPRLHRLLPIETSLKHYIVYYCLDAASSAIGDSQMKTFIVDCINSSLATSHVERTSGMLSSARNCYVVFDDVYILYATILYAPSLPQEWEGKVTS